MFTPCELEPEWGEQEVAKQLNVYFTESVHNNSLNLSDHDVTHFTRVRGTRQKTRNQLLGKTLGKTCYKFSEEIAMSIFEWRPYSKDWHEKIFAFEIDIQIWHVFSAPWS